VIGSRKEGGSMISNPLNEISDEVLWQKTKVLVNEERRMTAEVLRHLSEIERRKLFGRRGYSTLFEYAVRELKYSEAAAQRRILAMRLLNELPQVEEKIQSGELSLSVVCQT